MEDQKEKVMEMEPRSDLTIRLQCDQPTREHLVKWNPDPSKNIAPCCADNTCESKSLSEEGSPCVVETDRVSGLICDKGV
mmetsp:Transcript_28710/g.42279  ORF Transcript_28710/g.42279 Transcript_28710/m.42279 type:complete len:80 (-) Transcript_28710:358-597(-)|eukprot:CAMPEP_0194052510 /NCGR_PEP_ID=MMETSP0009_2-20130614/45746_1 /TAXON_ID=210454 /ORGANISM="Grammatophora oceanica, Strain CCMP 410" /LENGTH=79 /DNA_ID=CAMNT_0038700125 /DNA_START=206 /DNA_END=445 /DNA_ORIENTATION=-